MAHDKCIGTWERSMLNGSDDGNIRINTHSGNTFTGTHLKSGAAIKGISCDGTNIRFSREDASTHKKIIYSGEIILDGPKYRIRNGRFKEEALLTDSQPADAAADQAQYNAEKPARPAKAAPPPDQVGTWESEKPT